MKTEPFDKRIPCTLTPAEYILKSKALGQAHFRKANLVVEKGLALEKIKARIKEVDEEIKVLAEEARTGEEYREVQCVERPDWKEGMVETVVIHTGDVVARRPMLPEERQQKLRLEEDQARAAKKRAQQPSILGAEKPELEAGKSKVSQGTKVSHGFVRTKAERDAKPDNDNGDEEDEFKRGLQ